MPLTKALLDQLNQLIAEDGKDDDAIHTSTILESKALPTNAKLALLDLAKSLRPVPYIVYIDKLYGYMMKTEERESALDVVRAFKFFNDICWNNDIQYENYGSRSTFDHYFKALLPSSISEAEKADLTDEMHVEVMKRIEAHKKHLRSLPQSETKDNEVVIFSELENLEWREKIHQLTLSQKAWSIPSHITELTFTSRPGPHDIIAWPTTLQGVWIPIDEIEKEENEENTEVFLTFHQIRGEAFAELGRPLSAAPIYNSRALSDFNHHLKENKRYIRTILMRGDLYLRLQNPIAAEQDFKSVLEQKKTPSVKRSYALNRLATIYYDRVRLEQQNASKENLSNAIATFSEIIQVDSKDELALTRRARCYHWQKEHKLAIQDCKQVLEINPNSHDIRRLRAESHYLLYDDAKTETDEKAHLIRVSEDIEILNKNQNCWPHDFALKCFISYRENRARPEVQECLIKEIYKRYELPMSQPLTLYNMLGATPTMYLVVGLYLFDKKQNEAAGSFLNYVIDNSKMKKEKLLAWKCLCRIQLEHKDFLHAGIAIEAALKISPDDFEANNLRELILAITSKEITEEKESASKKRKPEEDEHLDQPAAQRRRLDATAAFFGGAGGGSSSSGGQQQSESKPIVNRP